MRTYGRITTPDGVKHWQQINTDPRNGGNDAVMLTTLCQCLLLNLGESPRFSNYGIPAHPAVEQQIFPDFYVSRTQQQFAQYFASLVIAKLPLPTPTYRVSVITHSGQKLVGQVPI